jgi:hypothetical protein
MRINSSVASAEFSFNGTQLTLTYCFSLCFSCLHHGRVLPRFSTEHSHRPFTGPWARNNFGRRSLNESTSQPGGRVNGLATVFNKRKYTASTTSASLSLSSSASSSAPSSPVSEVNLGVIGPEERFMLKLPRRGQTAKRPRLGLAPAGGGLTASSVYARETLAPPPVFRRRPSTPFNHSREETVTTGDQVGGLGCDEGDGDGEVGAGGNSETPLDLSSKDSLNLARSGRR